jgi:hypothetical protein
VPGDNSSASFSGRATLSAYGFEDNKLEVLEDHPDTSAPQALASVRGHHIFSVDLDMSARRFFRPLITLLIFFGFRVVGRPKRRLV